MTKEYANRTAALLVSDHNHYNKVGYKAATKDYRTALDNLIYMAAKYGWTISYTVSRAGYITLK